MRFTKKIIGETLSTFLLVLFGCGSLTVSFRRIFLCKHHKPDSGRHTGCIIFRICAYTGDKAFIGSKRVRL